ncbi:MAG TPA: DMT family transporter [Anaeromyxobacteraceae bacterium]|nr:DMT family transporter [Anaeromyxobacteraceae bacterium]
MTGRAWALFALVSLLWGTPYLLIRIALAELSPAWLVFLRLLVAAAVLAPPSLRGGRLRTMRGSVGWVVALAIVELVAPFLLITAGQRSIPSSLAALLIASAPLFLALMAPWLDPSERVVGPRLLGLVVGFAGVAVLMGLDARARPGQLGAAAMVLAAAACYAAGSLLVKLRFAAVPPLALVAAATGAGAVLLAPVAVLEGLPPPPGAGTLLAVAGLAVGSSAGGLTGYFALIRAAGASRASVVAYVAPAVAVALGIAFFQEPFTLSTAAGFLLILLGSWAATRRDPAVVPREAP